ncbi:MAG TPA: hypothetical protein PLW35_04320 [Verrucomicrobiota bacterium]|nr:hypothetical protein [Verrucomicrobiota bacterium]
MHRIEGLDPKTPVCYDPVRKKAITYAELLSGKEQVVPIDSLSDDDLKRLVVERLRAGPDIKVQAISGRPYTREDLIKAIEEDQPFGRLTLEAERAALRDLLARIQAGSQ